MLVELINDLPRLFHYVQLGSWVSLMRHQEISLVLLNEKYRIEWMLINFILNQSLLHSACGGMDNMCTVYDVNNRDATGAAKIVRELAGYEGFLSSCRFLDDTHIITGSGDMKICIWDLEVGKKTTEMNAHCGDVVSELYLCILQKFTLKFIN